MSKFRNNKLTILLAAWLLLIGTGFSLTIHYCQDQWSGFRVFLPVSDCADSCSSDTNRSCCSVGLATTDGKCCSNEEQYVKWDEDYFAGDICDALPVLYPVYNQLIVTVRYDFSSSDELLYPTIHDPPPLVIDVIIKNQSVLL
ncbi:hypothetical protein N8482_01980 [Chitinophagales bacterium]|nr:hypothetical protein [Chitinophagales bacterium]